MAKFGGALYFEANSTLTIKESSSVIFKSNEADLGGAIYFADSSVASFKECTFKVDIINIQEAALQIYSTWIFTNKNNIPVFIDNRATQGGAIYVTNESILQFRETSSVTFMYNNANYKGGAISCHNNSNIIFEEKSQVIFTNNGAELGGAVHLEGKSVFTCKGNEIEFY